MKGEFVMIVREGAAETLKREMQKSGKNAVRVELDDYGCGGPEVEVVLDNQKQGDTVIEQQGIKFIVTPDFNYLNNQIEIVDAPYGSLSGTKRQGDNR
jgi:Fe-S cluster assembly iron-binding protein IscA